MDGDGIGVSDSAEKPIFFVVDEIGIVDMAIVFQRWESETPISSSLGEGGWSLETKHVCDLREMIVPLYITPF